MIIWISGPYGVGKSALAEALAQRMENALIFDAEAVGNAVRGNYPDCPYGYIFEDYPLWGEFCVRLIRDVHEKFNKDILVPMTLLRESSFGIIEKLRQAGIKTELIVLEASHKTVHDRILKRGEEEGCWCMENIELSRRGSAALDGIHIETDEKTVAELAAAVLSFVGDKRCADSRDPSAGRKPTLILRDITEADIEDYIRWFTVETEWDNWDAPWEPIEDGTEEKQREIWTEYYQKVRYLPEDRRRWKFEIEADGVHIGWVSAYTDLDYLENEEGLPAIGICIPPIEMRSGGLGTQALKAFIEYYRSLGYKSVYTQTWSGNARMVRVADKLGFIEVCRKKDIREVNGEKYDAITWRLDLE
ncbi:MAG: GNAT family N-acetyltransferase [Clostridia bacterium]|nr:GNAT family N-acetyltransferase [Clostridia bacterium]